MFDSIIERINNNKDFNKSKLHQSNEFDKFIKSNYKENIINDELFDFCYVDICDKKGFVKVFPTSKFVKYLTKLNNDIEWVQKRKNIFKDFYRLNKNIDLYKNFQYMKSGKFIKKVTNLSDYEVESFTIKYKKFQDKFYKD